MEHKIKIKCPVCKKIREFEKVSISCTREYGYLGGEYLWFYRCEKCHIIIGKSAKDNNSETEGKR